MQKISISFPQLALKKYSAITSFGNFLYLRKNVKIYVKLKVSPDVAFHMNIFRCVKDYRVSFTLDLREFTFQVSSNV